MRAVLMAVCLSSVMGFAQSFPLAPAPGPQIYPNPMKDDDSGYDDSGYDDSGYDDSAHRKFEGLIGVQVHVGPPMKVEYRNFRLKVV